MNFEITKISDWDPRANITYAIFNHYDNFKKALKKVDKYSIEQIKDFFENNEFSLDSKKISKV
ncbi:MAG: CpG DNA methylase, partial [Mycoplasma sp.]|nr:CpG DNA methylase [Mycoplasma sp.]